MSDGRSTDRIEKLFLGDSRGTDSDGQDAEEGGFEGLFAMAGNTNEKSILSIGGPKIKRSANESLKIIHKMLLTKSYKYHNLVEEEFRTYETKQLALMNLGAHFFFSQKGIIVNSKSKDDIQETNYAIEIIEFLLKVRKRSLKLEEIISKPSHLESIEKEISKRSLEKKNRKSILSNKPQRLSKGNQ